MKILITPDYFPDEWLTWDWPGLTLRKYVWRRGLLNQPIFPNVEAIVIDPDTVIKPETLYALPHLKVIVTASTGTDHIDLVTCEERGVDVLSLLDDRESLAEIRASSEFTFLLVLLTLRNGGSVFDEVNHGRWHENTSQMRGNELYGKSVGIIGLGRIGKNIYDWCYAFGARPYWYDPYVYEPRQTKVSEIEQLFDTCDIIVVCCALNDETRGLIQKENLVRLKQGAILINTSRGAVINEADLVSVLEKRPDIRVGVDVLVGEGDGAALLSPLIGMPNVIVTPHVAGLTYESNEKAARIACKLLREYCEEAENR
jgi:phosphoglycerate dehydrogenase-like enzyme